jgi:hypothetical protein
MAGTWAAVGWSGSNLGLVLLHLPRLLLPLLTSLFILIKEIREMGFRPEPTIYKLNFKDSRLEGLTVRIGGCTVSEWQETLRNAEPDSGEAMANANDQMMALFAKYLVEWDLDDPRTGQPVPPTVDGIASQENKMITEIVIAWQKAMMFVADDLGKGLTNGGLSEEASLGLAASSQSLQNWPQQN